MRNIGRIWLAVALLLYAQTASAEEKEPLAVIGLGAAFERGSESAQFSRGPSAAIEFNAIKDWLEIEVGGAKLFRRGHSEWEAEVVFRKPFDLSETTEFMVGLGPTWLSRRAKGQSPVPHSCSTSCSGHRPRKNTAGLSSRVTRSARATKDRSP